MEYQHGGDIYGNQVEMDYSANINPLGLPEGVKKALYKAIETCSCYPDSSCRELREALSKFHHINKDYIICGNGAADLIFQIVQAVKPERAFLMTPTFSEYEQALAVTGTELVYYDLKEEQGFKPDSREFIRLIEENITQNPLGKGMVFLCNPNNPTGFALKKEEVSEILDYCRTHSLYCVVDQCFTEFLDEPEVYSVLNITDKQPQDHVFILKAFTKLYAMAGVRLGYGICNNRELLETMESLRQPWTVSSLAQAAGVAALKETKYVKKTKELICTEREFLKDKLKEAGLYVYDSMANYIFFRDLRPEAQLKDRLLYHQCLEQRLLIRSCGNYRGLDSTYYRICVKGREENLRFLHILQGILSNETEDDSGREST